MFINDNFMLKNKTSQKLYDMVKDLPIIDYHCHLEAKKIAENYKFKNAYDLFLSGDHYKWRQMRTHGIDEKYITGNADDYDKFAAFAEMMPYLIGNPLYHWTQLELKRYFNIDEILSKQTCKTIWDKCNSMLQKEEFSVRSLIKKSNVEIICTTDDPNDTLQYHKEINGVKVLPTFRPDKLTEISKDGFSEYISEIGVNSYDELISWLTERINYFNNAGCRLADHALEYIPFAKGDAKAVFDKKMNGSNISNEEEQIYKTAVISHCAKIYSEKAWAMQLHIGALRNNNLKMFKTAGADSGFDSINDISVAEPLSRLLNNLEQQDILPKTILYPLNPKDNYVIGAMAGNFQKAPIAGRIQFGSGWWFNDQKDGMTAQIKALANLGMLSHFIGMLTDSRSFVSYTRHEYFRRILCNIIGEWVEEGEYPDDFEVLKEILTGICYNNAKKYFNF